MIHRSGNTSLRFLIGAILICTVFIVLPGMARAESAADYASPFNILTQFDPAALTPDADGNYLLKTQMSAGGLGNFRVYIPAGAIKVNINFYAGVDAQVGMAARYTLPPQCDYTQISYPYWFCFPWDRDGGSLSGMTNADMRFRNRGGHAFVVDQYYSSPLTQGGWLYLKVLDPDPSYSIYLFEYAVIVNGEAYRAWHDLGSVPAPSGTVSGSCVFTADPDCSPSSAATPSTPTTPTVTNPFAAFFNTTNNNNNNNSSNSSPANLFASLFNNKNLSPTQNAETPQETRLDIEIDTTESGVGGQKIYRDADLANYSMITFNVSLKFDGLPSEDVDCFAMIVANGGAAFIERETLFDGPSWLLFGGTDRIYRYGSENIAEETTWTCTAFDFLNSLYLPPSFFTENGLQFIYAIAPVGEVQMGKYENVRYGVITFLPDEETEESPTGDEATEE